MQLDSSLTAVHEDVAMAEDARSHWVKLELGNIGREEILRRILQDAMALAQKCLDEARQPAPVSS